MSIKKTASKPKPKKPAAKAEKPSAALVPVKPPSEKFNNGKARKSFKVWAALDTRAKQVKGAVNVTRADSFSIGRKLSVPFSKMNNYFYRWRRFNGVTGVIGGKNLGNGAKKAAHKSTGKKPPAKPVLVKKAPAKAKQPAKKPKVKKKAPTALQVATKRAAKSTVAATAAIVSDPQAPESGPLSGQSNG